MKKSEKRGFFRGLEERVRNILLEKYAFSIALILIFVMAFMISSNLVYASPIKENVTSTWDSFVADGFPNTNYGTNTELQIKDGVSGTFKRVYIQFDLANYTNLTSISFSKVCLFLKTDGTTNNVSIYTARINGTNLESTITWNNQPCGTAFNNATACNLTAQSERTTTGNNQYYCWNVTFITQTVVDKNLSNITFVLKTPETTLLSQDEFWSRDYTVNPLFRPYAEITYCNPNWVSSYTTCGTNLNSSCGTYLNKTFHYTDTNNCGSIRGLPADNGTCVACNSPPIVTFSSQTPAQLTNFILYNQTFNATYSISDLDNNLDLSTIKLFYKTNNSIEDIVSYVNGTAISGFQKEEYAYNTSSNFLFSLEGDYIYAGTFNYPQDTIQTIQHHNISLFSSNDLLAIELLNVSMTKNYGTFEIMMNRTLGILSSSVFYCNSSYDFASALQTNINCHKFGILNNSNFQHNHTIYSSHQILSFAINITSGAINSVIATSKSYFIVSGGVGTWNAFYINNTTRAGAFKLSPDDGSTWVEQNFTVDAHLHQFSTTTHLWYYACANDTNNNQTCSPIEQQGIKLEQLNPTSPFIISPISNTYSGIISINYTEALSPLLNTIVNYSISLLNADETFNSIVIMNNGINLGYLWNSSTIPDGNYRIRVIATDNMSLTSFDISEVFTIVNCVPNWNLQYTPCGSTINASCTGYNNRTKYYVDINSCGNMTGIPADNGTCNACDYCSPAWSCSLFDTTCNMYWMPCLSVTDNNFATCCAITGYDSDCNFAGDLDNYKKPCGIIHSQLVVPQYPYVDCNTSYSIAVILDINGTRQQFDNLYITFPSTNQTFNFTWDNATLQYEITFIFPTGDYPFLIWEDYPVGAMENITGTFIARCPYYVNVQVFRLNPKNQSNPYLDSYAYITAEFEDNYGIPYSDFNERYFRPISFKELFTLKVFHAPYINGQATLKLWEKDKTYAFRLIDGQMSFYDGIYSKINMTKSYGTNIYLGTVMLNGTNDNLYIFLTESEIHPYQNLVNWTFLGLFILTFIGSIALLFIFPPFAISFGVGMSIILLIIRIIIWIYFKF
jgi:hypothetical protein